MREKLLDLMKNEGLKPSQLAEMLEINPAGVSHILAGRNKPGFDLLQKILRRFPRINPDWLLLDSQQMYRDAESSSRISAPASQPTPASDDLFATATPSSATTHEMSVGTSRAVAEAITHTRNGKVERVVIFYDDQTFDTYSPTKR